MLAVFRCVSHRLIANIEGGFKYDSDQSLYTLNEGLREFIHELSETTGEYLPVEYVDGTYEIEANGFTLTFTNEDEVFEIRSIDVRGNAGLGRQIVSTIHDYADEHGFEVIASNVLDTARGFWEKMGYQEGDAEDEYSERRDRSSKTLMVAPIWGGFSF